MKTDGQGGRRAALVVNTHARRGQKAFGPVKRLLVGHGFEVEARAVDRPDELDGVIAELIGKGHRLVVLGGGDGTISSAVGAFAGTDVVLAVLPLGTANSFARALGIPLDLAGAVGVVAHGTVARIDLGRIGERYFTNVLSIGLQTAIARSVSPGLKRLMGRGAYLAAAARQIGRFQHFACRFTLDGTDEQRFDAVLEVRIANGPFKGGMLMAPEADLASGDLVIHVVKGRSWFTLGRVWARIAAGGRPDGAVLESLRAAKLRLAATPPQDVSVDGEVAARTPIEVEIVPGALKVMRAKNSS